MMAQGGWLDHATSGNLTLFSKEVLPRLNELKIEDMSPAPRTRKLKCARRVRRILVTCFYASQPIFH